MASKKHGVKPKEWAQHLRPKGKRCYNKAVRKHGKQEAKNG